MDICNTFTKETCRNQQPAENASAYYNGHRDDVQVICTGNRKKLYKIEQMQLSMRRNGL